MKSLLARSLPNMTGALELQSTASVLLPDVDVFHDQVKPKTKVKTSQDLAEELARDFDAGFAEGQRKAQAIYEDTLRQMEAVLDGLKQTLFTTVAQVEASHSKVVRSILDPLLSELGAKNAAIQMETLISQAAQSGSRGALKIEASPQSYELLIKEARLKRDDIEIEAVEQMSAGAARFVWRDGTSEINPDELVKTSLSLFQMDDGASPQQDRQVQDVPNLTPTSN